jgi:lipopolysaccharide biosynthesis protein
MRRICLFSFYDEHGVVDDYVIYFLREIGRFAEKIIFFSNGPLAHDSETALDGVVADVIVRPNEGFDVMAYKEGLERIGFDADGLYDEVLMVNHTCYGPIFPFAELFGEMEKRECDFWGVTAHLEMTPNPLTGTGTLPYHLNANFIAVRSRMLRSEEFRQYWHSLDTKVDYISAIMSHEALFTEHFKKLGYKDDCYLNSQKYGTHYPAILDIDETLLDRNPLVKRRAFFSDPRFLEHYAADLPRAIRIIKETSNYNSEFIWYNAVRSAELRSLNTNAALTSVLPDVRLKQDDPSPEYGNIAVCAHVYYTDMLEEILSLTDTIPVPYDFIATTETAEKKRIIEETAAGRKNIKNVIVRVVEQNRGRDMSSLFITCRDLFLDDRYDLVCRLHTKKSPQVASGRGNLFKRHMFENLLNSPGFTSNVLDMFKDNPWIGVAVPPVVHISYWTLGHAWYVNREKAEKVKLTLDLKVHFDPDTPIAAYGTMFWFRPKALRKLFHHKWEWTDFNAEPHHVDGSLAHALERLIGYVAQDAHYTTQQILSSHLAGWNYAMLEYKLQKLSAALPNSDFSYQSKILEDWKTAGYPISYEQPSLLGSSTPVVAPPTIRLAWAQLVLATKRSIAHRSPRTFKMLSPVYRAVTGRSGRPS